MNGLDILIVEDELLIAHNLSRKIEKLGYNVVGIVTSGEAAIQVAAQQNPAVVLMDIVIKGEMDGIETATQIYQRYGIPIIYLTAYADNETLMRAEKTEAYGYLLKPFNEIEINATIRMTIRRNQQKKALLKSLKDTEKFSHKLQTKIRRTVLNIGDSEDLGLEQDLHFALEREEFLLYYQPLIDLQTNKIVGAEALLRWDHPQRGMILPSTFIPLTEETGMIIPIGEWVLRKVCSQLKSWQTTHDSSLEIWINISPVQLKQDNFPQGIEQIIKDTNLNPNHLNLELTESLMIDDKLSAIQIIKKLKSLGIQLAIDDFGTGYSSLECLHYLPFDILKIDRYFIHNVMENPDKITILKAIIKMSHQLNLKTVAESVETLEERELLYTNKCDLAQGYLFSPPISAEDFDQLLRRSDLV